MDERLAVVDDSFNFKLFDCGSGCDSDAEVAWAQFKFSVTSRQSDSSEHGNSNPRNRRWGARTAARLEARARQAENGQHAGGDRRATPVTCSVDRHPLVDQVLDL